MKSKIKRLFAATMSLMLVFSILGIVNTDYVSAKSKKTYYYLPTKVVMGDTTTKYKYNKYGDVTQVKEGSRITKIKWTYKKGNPVKAVSETNRLDEPKTVAKFDKKGRMVSKATTYIPMSKPMTLTNKYKYKKGFVKSTKGISPSYKLSITFYKNGTPKTITSKGKVYKFNKKGLVVNADDAICTYKYDKKGRVKSMSSYYYDKNGEKKDLGTIYYSYGKAKTTDKKKYMGMMARNSWGEGWPMEKACEGILYPEHSTYA